MTRNYTTTENHKKVSIHQFIAERAFEDQSNLENRTL